MNSSFFGARVLFRTAFMLFLILAPIPRAYAQTTATMTGTVKDTSGGVLPGVQVTATNLDTGIGRSTVSDDEGRYTLSNLSLGNYQVAAELPGFSKAVRAGITLTVGRQAVVDLVLRVGELTEQVTVTAEAPLVESTRADVGGFVDDKKIRDLPLNARSFTDLALFQTGVKLSRVSPTSGITSGGYGTMMTVSGARPESNVYKLDGTDVSDVWQKGTGSVTQHALGVEAVREFEVLTHNYGAQQGKFSGGVVNVVTRSGSNELHGTLFTFHRNDNLDARNFFDRRGKPEFKRNQFGFALGGPLVKDRAFIFGNYEGLRDRLGQTVISRVPAAAARQGLLQNPVTRQFTPVQIKPAVLPYLNLYPLPTPGARDFFDGTAEFVTSVKQPSDQDYFAIRFDDQLTKNDSFFTRYTFNDGSVLAPRAPYNLFALSDFNRNQYVTLEETHIFNPTLLSTLRFGYSRTRIGEFNAVLDPGGTAPSLVLVPGKLMPELSPQGVSSIGPSDAIPEIFTKNLFDGTYELSYSRGKHRLKAGVQLQREQLNIIFETRQNSRWTFPSLRDFLEGTNVSRMQVAPPETADPYRAFRQWYGGFFVQDDLKAGPSLTLNLGLRAEFTTVMTEKGRKMSFLPEARFFQDGSNADLVVGESWYENPGLHWAPRFGFAWQPGLAGNTVLRGGAGLFYDHILPFWHTIGAWRMFPFYNVIEANRLPDRSPLPFPLTAGQIISLFGAQSNQIWQFQLRPDKIYTLHFNLNVQHQLATNLVMKFAYTGSRGVHLGSISAFNEAQPIGRTSEGLALFGPLPHPRPNRNYQLIDVMTTGSDSYYHGMELEVNKQFSRGFQFQGSYTFSKMIDTKAGLRTAGDPEGSIRRDFADLLLRGLSPFDVRHNFTLNSTYDFPSPSSALLRQIAGGWQVNGLLTLASGHPFTVTQRALAGDLKQISRPDLAPGRDMGSDVVLGSPDRYFDRTAFLFSDVRRFGNLGRNTLIGPGLATLDFSLIKNFAVPEVSEEFKIQFRSEFFNIFNRANFTQPTASVFDGRGGPDLSAGRITSTSTTARQIQFGLKIVF